MAPKSAFSGTGRTLSDGAAIKPRAGPTTINIPSTAAKKTEVPASNSDNVAIKALPKSSKAKAKTGGGAPSMADLAKIRKDAHEAKKLEDELNNFQAEEEARISAESKARVEQLRKEYVAESRAAAGEQ